MKSVKFNPALPRDLARLKVNLLWTGTTANVINVGFRTVDENGLPYEEFEEVNGDSYEAQKKIDGVIIPRLRKLLVAELAELAGEEEDGGNDSESEQTIRDSVAEEKPTKKSRVGQRVNLKTQ